MIISRQQNQRKKKRMQLNLYLPRHQIHINRNETINSETPSQNKYLEEISENACFKVQDTENQTEFERSVETSSTPTTKTIPETIYEFKPKKPDLELSNSSKILTALFDEREFIKTYAKYRKQLKENKKRDKDTIATYKKVAAETEVKIKIGFRKSIKST